MLNSISWRIQILYLTLLALVIGGLLVALHTVERERRLAELDSKLDTLIHSTLPQLGRSGRPRRGPGPREESRPMRAEADAYFEKGAYLIAWDSEGEVTMERGDVPANLEPTRDRTEPYTRDGFRERRTLGPMRTTLRMGIPIATLDADLKTYAWKLVLAGLGVFAVSGALGFLVVRRGLKPLDQISRSAKEIAAGDLGRRIETENSPAELVSLSETLNDSFKRIENEFKLQEQFTADASHELRTPLSSILGQSQLMLKGERTPDEYREAFLTCEKSARRMKHLVEELAELSRFDAGQLLLDRKPADLEPIVRSLAEQLTPIAEDHGASISLDTQPAPCTLDLKRFERVITNLLSNCWMHNSSRVTVTIRTGRDHDGCASWLSIEDDGAGIPEDQLPHIFDRFYRTDAARAHDPGNDGSGLGLAICKAIVDTHGGTLNAENLPKAGCRTTVNLPD